MIKLKIIISRFTFCRRASVPERYGGNAAAWMAQLRIDRMLTTSRATSSVYLTSAWHMRPGGPPGQTLEGDRLHGAPHERLSQYEPAIQESSAGM